MTDYLDLGLVQVSRIFPTLIGNFDYLVGEAEKIGTAHNAYLEILMLVDGFLFLFYISFRFTNYFFVRNF